jgi:hypothetical protein
MDPLEIDRVAAIIHDAFRDYCERKPRYDGRKSHPNPWGDQSVRYRDTIRAVAVAVLADLAPAPLIVTAKGA